MKILLLILCFSMTSVRADSDWKCSNWKPVVSSILLNMGVRNKLIQLSAPTSDWKLAKLDMKRSIDNVTALKKKMNYKEDAGYELTPVMLKKDGKFQVVLSECWENVETASLLLQIPDKKDVGVINFKLNSFEEIKDPDCIHCNR